MTAGHRSSLPVRILIGLVLGVVAGLIAQQIAGPQNADALKTFAETWVRPVGQIFLYAIFMVVVPLLFAALVLGVSELGDARKVGRIGFYSLLMTVVLSGIGVGVGLVAVNAFNPAKQIPAEQRQALLESYSDKKAGEQNVARAQATAEDPPLLGIIPRNPLKEAHRALEGGLLPFMFFALVFGVAMSQIEREKAEPLRQFFDGLFAVTLKIIDYAMAFAPIGVFALMFFASAVLGLGLLGALAKYVVLVLAALAFHMFVTYSLALRFIAKRSPGEFFRQIKTVILTAFATSSSNATLPTALRAAEEDVKLPPRISRFVLTIGATANQNGTALFEGITIIFLASMFGKDLNLAQQLTVMGLAIVAGIGTAGVPGGAWPMIAIILTRFEIPAEAIGLVLGIDRLLDMSRTVLNVTGDLTIAACVARLDGNGADTPPPLEPAVSG